MMPLPSLPINGERPAYAVLAQRGEGPFRAQICRRLSDDSLTIRVERLNTTVFRYDLLCELNADEWAEAVKCLASLTEAIPEASHAITKGLGTLPWEDC